MDLTNNFDCEVDDEFTTVKIISEAAVVDATGRPINKQSVTDLLINAEVLMPKGDSQQMDKVT